MPQLIGQTGRSKLIWKQCFTQAKNLRFFKTRCVLNRINMVCLKDILYLSVGEDSMDALCATVLSSLAWSLTICHSISTTDCPGRDQWACDHKAKRDYATIVNCNTVLSLKDCCPTGHPIGHKHMVSQDRWSFMTGMCHICIEMYNLLPGI